MAGTIVKQCSNCGGKAHEQDKIYGKGNRLWNVSGDGKAAKCTVCGTKK
jgi:hypothetical protein